MIVKDRQPFSILHKKLEAQSPILKSHNYHGFVFIILGKSIRVN